VRQGKTTALKMGPIGSSVAKELIAPPPSSLGPPLEPASTAEPLGIPLCDCGNPERNCSPAQQRACTAKDAR
jgi:hypothetical protein